MHKDFGRLLMSFVLAFWPLLQFGVLCFLGQNVTSASEDLMDATYDCEWHQRDPKFKKILLIIREMCRQKVEFGALSMSFSHENFKNVSCMFHFILIYELNQQVMACIYNSYTTLSESVDHLQNL